MGLISGIHRAYRGKVSVLGTAPQEVSGKIALLPQDPQTLFVKNTVIEDLLSVLDDAPRDRRKALALEKARLCELTELLERHPYDLSGGEQSAQRCARCCCASPRCFCSTSRRRDSTQNSSVCSPGLSGAFARAACV